MDNLGHLQPFNEEMLVMDDYSDSLNDWMVLNFASLCRSDKRLGKEGYWQQWKIAFAEADRVDDDLFIFMPDDFMQLDYEKILELHDTLKVRPYSFNLINDGRDQSFRHFTPKPVTINDTECMNVGFNDCGFFCNRATLEKLNFRIDPVSPSRFHADPLRSSGVGEQLTLRMRNAGIYMLMPVKSLAVHGDHESIMHKTERKRNPLISKH